MNDGNYEPTTKAYDLAVDENDKAKEFRFLSFGRPHMRTFYVAIITTCVNVMEPICDMCSLCPDIVPLIAHITSRFVGMWLWISVSPLQIAIKNTTIITDNQLNMASTCSILGSMFARLAAGAMTDRYGASRPMFIALIVSSLATGLTSLVNSGAALSICRFLSGSGGSALVIAQAWTAATFSKNIIGAAMGLVLGIGYTGE
jgi:NNP family nitrate/nitrite transporter-like MFS transporter